MNNTGAVVPGTALPVTRTPFGRLLLGLLIVAAAIHLSFLGFHWGGAAYRNLVGDLLNLPAQLLSGLMALYVSRHHPGATRRAWMLIGLAYVAYCVGNGLWAYIELVLKLQPFPSVADVFFLLFPILLLMGLMSFPRGRSSQLRGWQLGLDVAIIVGAVGVFAWRSFLAQTVASYGERSLELVISIAYPALDLALLSLLLVMTLGGRNQGSRLSRVLLGAGLAGLILSDTLFNVQTATESYVSGGITDSGWTWAALLIGLAAYCSFSVQLEVAPERAARRKQQRALVSAYAPYLAIGLGYAQVIQAQNGGALERTGVLIGTGLILVIVMVRQSIAFVENRRLNRELRAFSSELEHRVEERTAELGHVNKELWQLSEGLERRVEERTAALLESRQQLATVEKLAGLGRLTANLAHEINTPLAALMNNLYRSRELAAEYRDSIGAKGVTDDDHREIAAELLETIHQADATGARIGEFIRRIRGHTRDASSVLTDFDPSKVAADAMALLETQARTARVSLHLEPPGEIINVHGESGRFAQIVNNLVANAIHACEGHGTRVEVRFRLEGDLMVMEVEDDGSGIPEDVLPRIFEPLFTTKDVGKGTGLGLSIIQDIVQGHFSGEITVQTARGHGAIFSVRVPIRPSRATRLTAPLPVSASSPS